MRSHLRALADHLAPLGYPVHLYHAHAATEQAEAQDRVPSVPYLVLRGAWGSGTEIPVCDETDTLDTTVLITGTASTAEGAGVVLDRVRRLLSPRASWSEVPMDGRRLQVRRVRSEIEPQIDRDLRLPNSNRHPGFGVDSYRLHSQPS